MTYIVLQRGRQREGAGGWDTHKTGEISKGRSTIQRKRAGEAPPSRRALRGGAGRGPAGGAAAHRPVSAAEAARLQPSPWHTNACVRGSLRAWACAPLGKQQPRRWRRGDASPAGRGPRRAGGGGDVWGVSWSASDGGCVPSSAVLPRRGEGGDGERAGAGRGWGSRTGLPGLPGRLRRGVATEAAGSRQRGVERSAPRSPADSFSLLLSLPGWRMKSTTRTGTPCRTSPTTKSPSV